MILKGRRYLIRLYSLRIKVVVVVAYVVVAYVVVVDGKQKVVEKDVKLVLSK